MRENDPAAGGPDFALNFDGGDDRVQVGRDSFPTVVDSFTIDLWVNPTATRAATGGANAEISGFALRSSGPGAFRGLNTAPVIAAAHDTVTTTTAHRGQFFRRAR